MARYRQTDTRWIQGACVAGAYLVGVAVLFTRQVGEALVVPVPFAVSAPPLVYAALSIVMLRQASFVRRLSWIGGACLTHVLLGALAAAELVWAGGLPPLSAVAQVFVLFVPAPVLTLLVTPLVLTLFGPTAMPRSPRAESPMPRQAIAPPVPRPRSFARTAGARKAEPPVALAAPIAAVATAPPASAVTRPSAHVATPAHAVAPSPPAPAPPALPPPVGRSRAPAAAPAPESSPAPAPPREMPPVAARKPARHDQTGSRREDGMVRVSFERIAAQLPAEAFVLPFDRLGESLKEPHALLVPRRVVLAQMREGGIAIDWQTVASQFPELALGVSEAEFRARYPDLTLSLPVDEVLAQLPPDTIALASAVLNTERLEVPPPVPPSSNGRSSTRFTATTPASVAPIAPPTPAVPAAPPAASPPPAVVSAPPPAVTAASAPPPRVEVVDRETVTRIVACFTGAGTFEAAAERVAGTALVSLVAPGLSREAVAACAARGVRVLAEGGAEVVTVRTTRAVLVLAAGPTPVVVAARRPGAPVALLELRAARAAAPVDDGVVTVPATPGRTLKPLAVDGRVAGAGHALSSFGAVEPTVFADGGARVYVFSAAGRDATPVGGLALSVNETLGDGGGELGRLVSVVFRRGGERTLVRPLGRGAAVLAASGPVTRPGRVHRDADRAATMLEVL